MKLILTLILALSTTYVMGQQTFSAKCTCHADNFMAKQHDDRRCLTKVADNGIANCLETKWDTTHGLECTKCAPTHVISEKLECVEHKLPQCVEATINSGGGNNSKFPDYIKGFLCTKCNPGYFVNKDGWCTENPTSINNCTVYEQHGSGMNDTRCNTCEQGFWLQLNDKSACAPTPGSSDANYIANCEKYSNPDGVDANWICIDCEATYWKQLNTNKVCAPTPGSSDPNYIANCEEYKNNDGTNANWICQKCESSYWKKLDDSKACAPTPGSSDPNYIANCANYTNADGTAGNWVCADCNDGTWKKRDDSKECADTPANTAAGKIDNCETYKNPDGVAANWECITCEDTYIKNTANDKCWPTPISTTEPATWTENCKTWTHPTSEYACTVCQGHNFLNTTGSKPKCHAVQKPVEHCTFYTDVLTCTICEDRYWLEDGICVLCPTEKYVPPVPVTCPTNPGNSTNGGGSNPGSGGNGGNPGTGTPGTGTNKTTTNSIILQSGLVLALSLILL